MKVETLLELIGEIDDSFVEEATFGKKRISKMPWNLVATAACLCLVITTLVVLRSAGLLPVAPIPTDPTQTTQPTETTAPVQTTPPPTTTAPVSMPSTVDIETLFGDYDSWYACALTSLYESPENIDLYMFFRYGFEDEPSNYTDEEWQLLKTYWGFSHSSPSIRLPAKKMDSVLQEFFGLTLAETCGIG